MATNKSPAPAAGTPPPAKDRALVVALSNGIEILKTVTSSPHPLTPGSIAEMTGLSKTTTYRLLGTLEHHELVQVTEDGRYFSGSGLGALAANTQRSFRQMVGPALRNLADETGETAFVAVHDEDDAVTLMSATPAGFTTSLMQAPGTRHPVTNGAPGKAILSITPRTSWPALPEGQDRAKVLVDEVESVWRQGFATSHNEVLVGVSSIAAPFQVPGERACAIALLYTDQERDTAPLVEALQRAATAIESRA